MQRRDFVKNSAQFGLALSVLGLAACARSKDKKEEQLSEENALQEAAPFFKLSLAQWSLHKAIFDNSLNPMDFAAKAKALGFEGIEFVSQLYNTGDENNRTLMMPMDTLIKELNMRSSDAGIQNLLIMIDGEGDFSVKSEADRSQAVENHKRWVDAASGLGCHSIRVNLFGETDPEIWKEVSADSLSKISAYAAKSNINVLVENHGYLSSHGQLLTEVMKMVNMDNCGTLPDFGNFCLKREGGARWEASCVEEYDKYKGVEELMPYAKAVSAKSYDFDANGNETTIDYQKMLQIVKDAGYKGFIGVEYEGSRLSEEEGIIATRDLLISAAKKLS
ncbi:TIM barrel protein [Leptobacterium flavescens]|uniref:TIM barrel protein n=1 Tax=Leptobacterium flavescens TaxID=472055 RepID=A0A6P0URK9_9FLAO|nr:sugar phosphate isomerase/epimerase family protein [Leptobacterium flavescens]NER14419.1 TIM barrel protein [Leptobacterium flavescens]